jgi:hypothetical protein
MPTWTGSCHCGAVRFEVDGEIDDVLECNCTICSKKGFLHWIVRPECFRKLSGELTTYTFGTNTAQHRFCPRCGVHPFYTPRSHPDHVDVNVRCLDGVDLSALRIRRFDGRGDWEGSRAALDHAPLPPIEKVVVADKLALFADAWNPRIVAELNGQHVKLAKLRGPFTWHAHASEDELFYVVKGRLRMELRDRAIELDPGELVVIPRNVEHRPVANEEVHVMLFEPASTLNTGDAAGDPRTRRELQKI